MRYYRAACRNQYSHLPRWLDQARFGECADCGVNVKGKRVLYDPPARKVYCEKCAPPHDIDHGAAGMEIALGIAEHHGP
jgi:hypothetical protein